MKKPKNKEGELIAYGLMCDCGCKDPMSRQIDETDPAAYALFVYEDEAKEGAESMGLKIGKYKITLIE